MTTMTHDPAVRATPVMRGLIIALISAGTFGMSGALARGLLDHGWSPASLVIVRVLGAFVVLALPAARALRGRWDLLRRNFTTILGYGLMAVVVAQLGFFNAVEHLSVGASLLMEYTAPVAVVLWMWAAHRERPTPTTLIGAAVAACGLVVVLDLVSGTTVSGLGIIWGLVAMAGAATYFIVSARECDLPPIVLAAGGLLFGGLGLLGVGVIGLVPLHAATVDATYGITSVPWWWPLIALAVVTAAVAYVTGIAAARVLGARLASFVALTEVLFAMWWAWLLVGELARPIQLLGGVLVIVGVVVVKLGERKPELEIPINPN